MCPDCEKLSAELAAALIVSDNYAVRAEHAEAELAAANAALKHYRKLSNHMTNWAVEQDHAAAIERARKG